MLESLIFAVMDIVTHTHTQDHGCDSPSRKQDAWRDDRLVTPGARLVWRWFGIEQRIQDSGFRHGIGDARPLQITSINVMVVASSCDAVCFGWPSWSGCHVVLDVESGC